MATENDRAILESVINPLLSSSGFDENLSTAEESDTPISDIDDKQLLRVKSIELEGVNLAESGRIREAVNKFNEAIKLNPTWPSAYNNRAQAFRLLNQNEDALKDLEKAIILTDGKGKVASHAYCQRAMLHQLSGNSQEAFKDWESASKLGSSFARQQLIQYNPYAALCNKMLHDVFQSLKTTT